ncbi:MAG: MOSC domain-containing protein [Gammaproteobacteria bacterium]
MPNVARIEVYPIKSLDGVALSVSRISAGGTLEKDRDLALFDDKGRFVNGKRNPAVHRLRTLFDLESHCVTLFPEDSATGPRFHLERDRGPIEDWLSDFFGFRVSIGFEPPRGFPDDPEAFGPTIVSRATLAEIATWFPGLELDDVRRRFRANIEIDGVPAFWEDRLFDETGSVVDFTIGPVRFEGINPCQRCVVPSRDPRNGEVRPDFQKIFTAKRRETFPSWGTHSRFNHFYRLAVNTKIPPSESGKEIRVGDEIEILGVRAP